MKPTVITLVFMAGCVGTASPLSIEDCGSVEWGPADAPTWIAMDTGPLTVFVEDAEVAVAGRMAAGDGRAVFRPVFPLTPGLRYRVRSGRGCEASFRVASPNGDGRRGRVVKVYPTSDALPANLLRFYVYFSQPMAEGGFLDHVRLTHRESGQDLTGVFFDNIYELWSADRRRITLLVDPGRVKTGLTAHQVRGRAFVPGQTYSLHIEPTWPTLDGSPMRVGLTKAFRAVAEDRDPVRPRQWRIGLPAAGTRQPLRIDFGEPVDHVSVDHFLQVVSSAGAPVRGRWRLQPGDEGATWTPRNPWAAPVAGFRIKVRGRFEDVAGNNVNGAFDHRSGALADGGEDRVVIVPFPVRPR